MGTKQVSAPLDTAISQLETAAFNFSVRFIKDAEVRQRYMTQTRKLAAEFQAKVASGAMSAETAAKEVSALRNEILAAQRLRSSDIGKAAATDLKKTGLTLSDLCSKYAKSNYGKAFNSLSASQREVVYLEVIKSSGRARVAVNAAAQRISVLGRGLLLATFGIAIYNITTAEEKGKAAIKEGILIGGGFSGDAAGGALAGLACGPGAPVCVTVGVFVGGALGAMGAGISIGWFF